MKEGRQHRETERRSCRVECVTCVTLALPQALVEIVTPPLARRRDAFKFRAVSLPLPRPIVIILTCAMADYSLHFADHGGCQTGVFRLIELPKELIAIAEGIIEQRYSSYALSLHSIL